MGRIREREAAERLLRMIDRFLGATERQQDELAKDIEDFTMWDLMEYNKAYDSFSDDLKSIIDPLLLFHRWRSGGIRYGRELAFGLKDVRDLRERLRKLRLSFR